MNGAKYQAARDLLDAAKRDLQVVELAIAEISKGRTLVPADDVSTEHRVDWLGALAGRKLVADPLGLRAERDRGERA